jgi:lipopolysaccharide transport system permease protein
VAAPPVASVAPPPTVVIEPSRGWRALDLREVWRFRELVYSLALRDIKVRYKQTALGVAWVVLQPLLVTAIFTVIFGQSGRVSSDGLPYPLFALAGLVPWLYVANATNSASGSVVSNTQLISKVYFPRLVIPLAAVLAGLADFLIGMLLLLGSLLVYQVPIGPHMLALPLMVLLAVLTALSVGIWLSALDVQYRDVRYAVPFLVQVWFFATPVVYAAADLGERWRTIFSLNPMTGVIEGFRWALLGQTPPPVSSVSITVVIVALLLASGLLYFRRMERTFADVI